MRKLRKKFSVTESGSGEGGELLEEMAGNKQVFIEMKRWLNVDMLTARVQIQALRGT